MRHSEAGLRETPEYAPWVTTTRGQSRRVPLCLRESPYHFFVSGVGVSLVITKPVPPHFGQVTNPLRLLWAQTLQVPITTQDSLRASPVPLHAGHATSRFPPQRGHSAFSSPTGIPPFSRNRSPTEIRNAQSAVSEDRLYVILAMCTTPAVTRTFKRPSSSLTVASWRGSLPCRL